MLRFKNMPKEPTNSPLNSEVLEAAREMGRNISQTVDSLLADEVKRRNWVQWNEENQAAVTAYNDRTAAHGLALAKYRTWGQALGDGRATPACS